MRKFCYMIAFIVAVGLLILVPILMVGQRQEEDSIAPTIVLPPKTSPVTSSPADGNARFYHDYDKLWSIIENEYPFLAVAERVTGKDFLSIKNKYRSKLTEIENADQFFSDIIVPCLNEFAYTGHLSAITPEVYHQRYLTLQREIENDDTTPYGMLNWAQLNAPAALEFYGDVLVDSLSSKEENVAVSNFPEVDNISSNLELDVFPTYSTAYISIKSMTLFYENNDDSVLESFFVWIEENNYKHCIFDIQKNSGGSDGYWMLNLVRPNLKEALSYQYYALVRGEQSREYIEACNISVNPIADFPLDQFPNLSIQDFQSASYYSTSTVSSDNMGRRSGDPYEPLFSGDFWLLVGPNVYSSADGFAHFCKETGFAELVGTATGGDGMGLAPMVLSLPETGICIQFSTMGGLNADGSNNEEVGTEPDLLVPAGIDAFTYCLGKIYALD